MYEKKEINRRKLFQKNFRCFNLHGVENCKCTKLLKFYNNKKIKEKEKFSDNLVEK